jgi:hypothetical protein
MAVSKLQPDVRVREAIEAGHRLFGESRVQETARRGALFPSDAEVHMIGHLQRNKAADAAALYASIDSIDAERTARALGSRVSPGRRPLPILIEVNTSGEQNKHGVTTYDELRDLVGAAAEISTLEIRGLMTIGPLGGDETSLRSAFASLREHRDALCAEFKHLNLTELSMGMSNDFEEAILEGSTTVRIGTSLFGARE